MSPQDPAARFIRQWLLACVLLAAAVGGFNALMDPYLVFSSPRIARFNDRKPAVESEERLMKAYQATRALPRALVLGTSRVDLGLDTRHPAWPIAARPAYNLGIAAASPYMSYRYLQHVSAAADPELVILGLDFEYFLTTNEAERSGTAEFESRLAVDRDGLANARRGLQYAQDLLQSTLTLDALLDSIDTLGANLRADSANLAATGDLSEAELRQAAVESGSWSLFAQRDRQNFRTYYGKSKNDAGMKDIENIIKLCRAHHARLVMLVNPLHADMLESFDLLGLWHDFESWKRELATLVSAESTAEWKIDLWDFSGYDQYSTETVPTSGGAVLQWFWEPSHYTKALGDKILARIFGAGASDYGVLLTPETVESQLTTVRAARQSYRSDHAADVRRVRDIFAEFAGSHVAITATER